jgi:hypothetical protein
MKRLILPLIAAQSYWLILQTGNNYSRALEKIEMESMSQCEQQGNFFGMNLKTTYSKGKNSFVCLMGK